MEAKNFKQEQLHSLFCRRKLGQGQNMGHLTETVHQWQNDGVAIGRRKTSYKVQGDIAEMLPRSSREERPLNPNEGTKAANRTTTAAIYHVSATGSSTDRARAVGERSFAEVAAALCNRSVH